MGNESEQRTVIQVASIQTANIVDMFSTANLSMADVNTGDVKIVDEQQSESVQMVSFGGTSISTEVNPLLHSRLKAAIIVLMIYYGINFTLMAIGPALGWFSNFAGAYIAHLGRLTFLGVMLGTLYAQSSYSTRTLRTIEYCVFGMLGVMWIFIRYQSVIDDAGAGNIAEILIRGRERLIGLLFLIFVHALFIPHTWQGAARVTGLLSLAPLLVLLCVRFIHPELIETLAAVVSPGNLMRELAFLLSGSILAVYGASLLYEMRVKLRDARQMGQYRLIRRLGRGGMGEVYLAEHALLKRPCALKLINAEAAEDPTSLARFEREVRSTAQLTHPNTVEIFDYGHTDDGTFYYVMEFLPGLSLAQLIRRTGALPAGRVIYLWRQMCGALAEAHAAGLVHRDLKPANLYVSERGGIFDFIKVLDFGLVKLTKNPGSAQLTADHSISGTPHYMAPEQTVGERTLDHRVDIYALGAVAYQMLTGQLPFTGESPIAVMIAHASQPVVPPSARFSAIPKDVEAVVLRCLEKKPENRFSDVNELDRALEQCAAASDWDARQAAQWWQRARSSAAAQVPSSAPAAV